jgi:ribosome maturation factor RimP
VGSTDEDIEVQLRRVAEPILAAAGVELVELVLRGTGGRRIVRLDIDRAGPKSVDLDDCQRISRAVDDALDRADLFTTPYVLEVSSPGIDRPLRSPDDFRRNTGRRVVVVALDEAGSERTHRGTLLGCQDGELRMETEDGETLGIPEPRIVRARQDVTI